MNLNSVNNKLSDRVLREDRLDGLLAELGCDVPRLTAWGGAYRGPCPVHGGDGDNFHLGVGGHSLPVWWKCFSQGCDQEYKPSLLGLVRGVLSSRAGRKVPLKEAVAFLEAFVGREAGAARSPARPRPSPPAPAARPAKLSLSRARVRAALSTPSSYFLRRGFSRDVLDRFDVGHSQKLGGSVVPIYDDGGQTCVGYLMRSEMPPCSLCGRCHDRATACAYGPSRWAMSEGCPKSQFLYNYDEARRTPRPFVLLVEGPGDVWRAAEAGVPAVSPFGCDVTEPQADMLASLRKHVLIAFDNDAAGRKGAARAHALLLDRGVPATICPPPAPFKDIGDMPKEAVSTWLGVWTSEHIGGSKVLPGLKE